VKFLLIGDLHIDTNKPERRTDNYWETVQKKTRFIFDLSSKENAIVLQPGDFFNSHKANDFLKRWVIQELRNKDINILTVFGQHDLRYHSSDTNNTPLAVLQAAGHVEILSNTPLEYNGIHIYGASWFEEVPTPLNKDALNILVIHRMIIKDDKLWEGQEDVTMGNIFLKSNYFDLVVGGDNHNHFVISTKTRKHLVNCGSIFRTAIDQVGHTPIAYVYNTKDRSLDKHIIPHIPFDSIFNMDAYEEEKVKDEKMEAFFERLNGEVELEGLDFIVNMDTFVKENDEEIDDLTLDIIEEVMA